jgi:hypothetical protein
MQWAIAQPGNIPTRETHLIQLRGLSLFGAGLGWPRFLLNYLPSAMGRFESSSTSELPRREM